MSLPFRIIIRAVNDEARRPFIEYLHARLPMAEWVYDEERDAVETFLRGMLAAGEDPAVHMEEDVILTRGFVEKLSAAIDERPESLIQFFSMRKADIEIGSRWDRDFMMNQCHYHPAGYSRMIADFALTWERWDVNTYGYDIMMNDWLRSRKEPYWIHVPSLVDHRMGVSAINPKRPRRRQSLTFTDPWE